jgi:hypothetical protein
MVQDQDIFALFCPDWRGAALVLDCASLQVLYANWRCLELVHRGHLLSISADGLTFAAPEMDRRVRETLDLVHGTDIESTILMHAGEWPEPGYSVAIRRPQGLLGEVLTRHCREHTEIAVLELATRNRLPGSDALRAFAQAFGLTGPELRFISHLVLSDTGWETPAEARTESLRRAVMAKLGCLTDGEIVCLVMSLSPLEVSPGPVRVSRSLGEPQHAAFSTGRA